MTRLRELARQHADGKLDREQYRSAREDFISRIVQGTQPLEVNEYVDPVNFDDDEAMTVSPAVFVLDEDYEDEDYKDDEGEGGDYTEEDEGGDGDYTERNYEDEDYEDEDYEDFYEDEDEDESSFAMGGIILVAVIFVVVALVVAYLYDVLPGF